MATDLRLVFCSDNSRFGTSRLSRRCFSCRKRTEAKRFVPWRGAPMVGCSPRRVETKENVLSFFGHSNSVSSAVWSPDGRWIASKDSSGVVLIWEAQTGSVRRKLRCSGGGSGQPYSVGWSPQGDKLAAGSGNGTIMVWETTTGRVLQALKGHPSKVRSVQWSPDGQRLVSAAEDHTIQIWDPQSGHELLVLSDPQNRFPSVAWSPSGRMIGVANSVTLIYDATLGYELAPQLAQSPTNR